MFFCQVGKRNISALTCLFSITCDRWWISWGLFSQLRKLWLKIPCVEYCISKLGNEHAQSSGGLQLFYMLHVCALKFFFFWKKRKKQPAISKIKSVWCLMQSVLTVSWLLNTQKYKSKQRKSLGHAEKESIRDSNMDRWMKLRYLNH